MAGLALRKLAEGPVPFGRTMRRAAFQLLPARAQAALLALRHPAHVLRRAARLPAPASGPPDVRDLVSVVLPVHGQAALLGAAVDSVLAQTWSALELIVLDDGSGPEVAEVLRARAGDPRLRRLRQPNRGLPAALNAAFAFARGEFLCWTSADNVMLPDHVATLVRALRARPAAAMVYGDYELMDERGAPVRGTDFRVAFRRGPHDPRVRLPRGTLALALVHDNFVGPCFCYRASAARVVGEYADEPGLEDYDYWLRLDRTFRVEHAGGEAPLYRYRLHQDSMTARGREMDLQRRGRGLLARERKRAARARAPVRVVAEGGCAAWVRPLLRRGVVPAGEARAARGTTLFVADARDVAWRALPPGAAGAVWFDELGEVHRAAHVLADPRVLAFAACAAVAERLAIFTRRVLAGGRDPAALALARAFAIERAEAGAPGARVLPVPAGDAVAPIGCALRAAELPRRVAAVVAALAARAACSGDVAADGAAGRAHRVRMLLGDDPAIAPRAAACGVRFVQLLHDASDLARPETRAELQQAAHGTAAYLATSVEVVAAADRAGVDPTRVLLLPPCSDASVQAVAAGLRCALQWLQEGGAPAAARAWLGVR